MLETIREYASELLDASAEADERPPCPRRVLPRSRGRPRRASASPDQALWRARLEADHGNFRAAIRLSLDDGDTATALELCALLSALLARARLPGRGPALARRGAAARDRASATRARALNATASSPTTRATTTVRTALRGGARAFALTRRPEKRRGGRDGARAREADTRRLRRCRGALPEAIAIYEELGDEAGTARTLDRFAVALILAGEQDRARPVFERSLELFRRLGERPASRSASRASRCAPEGADSRRGRKSPRASRSFAGSATVATSRRCSS